MKEETAEEKQTIQLKGLTKEQLIKKCKIAEENYTKIFRENVKLIMFYSQIMESIYKGTRILEGMPVQYKVVENQEFIDSIGGVRPLTGF